MLSSEENETLTRTGPGTPMGELLRRKDAVDSFAKTRKRTRELNKSLV